MNMIAGQLTGLKKGQEIRLMVEEGREGLLLCVSASECSEFRARSKHTQTIKFYVDELLDSDTEIAEVIALALSRAAEAKESANGGA